MITYWPNVDDFYLQPMTVTELGVLVILRCYGLGKIYLYVIGFKKFNFMKVRNIPEYLGFPLSVYTNCHANYLFTKILWPVEIKKKICFPMLLNMCCF